MEDQPNERKRVARVKELEEIVKKLEQENRKLLDKVRTGSPTLHHKKVAEELLKIQDSLPSSKNLDDIKASRDWEDVLDDSLSEDMRNLEPMEDGLADEWLYISPKLPPTPSQKKMTPIKWLSEGHTRVNEHKDLPSLDEVRKSLMFNIDEAENLKNASNDVESPMSSSPLSSSPTLRARAPLNNRTAQRYLQKVRDRRASSPNYQSPSPPLRVRKNEPQESVPIVKWKGRRTHEQNSPPPEIEEDIPKVAWQVKQVPSSPPSDDIPRVKWNVKQVPSSQASEYIPKVKWDPSKATASDSFSEEEEDVQEESIPVVKWKARVPREPSGGKSPRNSHQARTAIARNVPAATSQDDVPVVKWRARNPDNEDVPVVRGRSQHQSSSPRQRFGLGSPKGSGLTPPSRRAAETQENEDEGHWAMNGGSGRSSDNLRRSRYDAHKSNLQKPLSGLSPSNSPPSVRRSTGYQRNVSPGQPQTLRSRSPSPLALQRHSPQGAVRSRSPSPSIRNSGVTASHSGISPSPSSKTTPSQGGLLRAEARGGLRQPVRRQGQSPPSQNELKRHPSGLPHSPSGGGGARRQQSGLRGPQSHSKLAGVNSSLSATKGSSSGIQMVRSSPSGTSQIQQRTPPSGQDRPKRRLPTPPSAGASSNKVQKPKPGLQRVTPPRYSQPVAQYQGEGGDEGDDDSWLEGCF